MGGKDSKQLERTASERSNKSDMVTGSADDESAKLVSYRKSHEPSLNSEHVRENRTENVLPDHANKEHVQPEHNVVLTESSGQASQTELLPVTSTDLEMAKDMMDESSLEEVTRLAPTIQDNLAIVVPQVSSLPSTPQLNITGNISIVHHSDKTVISGTSAPVSPNERKQLSYTENLREQMESIANWHEKKDHLFIETNAYKELRNILDDIYWVTLLGKPGDGKSSTAGHVMLEYRRKGYEPVFVTSSHDWKALIAAGSVASEKDTKQIVVIDDIFGTSCLDQGRVGEWLSLIENMGKLVEERNGNLLVICTSRRYIFSDVEASLARFKYFRKIAIVDMTDIRYKLSGEEKENIFDALAAEHNVSDVKGNDVKHIDSPHGFPLCAEMFCANSFLRRNGVEFFRNPVECVQKEILNFKDNDNQKYIVLLTMVLKRNMLPRNYFDNLCDVATDDEKRFFKSLGISLDTASPGLVKARNALINTYLMTTPDGYYTFIHETLMENVADIYLSASSYHAIEMIEFKYVAVFLNRSVKSNRRLPEDLYEPICKRLTTEIKSGNVLEVCRCDGWGSDAFIETWIEYLQSDVKTCDTEEILRTKDSVASGWDIQYKIISDWSVIDYSPVTTYELKSAALYSMINTLIYCKRNRAVIALLAKDFIQFIKHESYWNESLELGLDITCTQGDNIDVVKAILSAKDEGKLNGSRALAISLAFSNLENAEALLNGSDISPHFADTSGRGYFHYLIDSNITIDKFETITKLLNDARLNINETDITGEPLIFSLAERLVKQVDGVEKFKILVKAGASIDVKDVAGRNLVLYSLEKLNAKECLKLFPVLEEEQTDFQCVDQHGANAMHYFCNQKDSIDSEGLFKFLVEEKNINVSQIDSTGKIPLMLALLNACQNYSIAELLERSPKGHIDMFGRGFFHYLCSSNALYDQFCYLCNAVLNKGENANLLDSEGISPLFECVRNINFSLEHIQHLIACGANIDVTDECGRNIVLYTIFRRCKQNDIEQFLDFLFQNGVSFHALDHAGKNALHYLFNSDDCDNECDTGYFNSVYDFLTTVAHVDCFQPDNVNVTPVFLALEHYPDLAFVKRIIGNDIPDQMDNRGRNYFHFLVHSNTSDETFREVSSTLKEKNIDVNHKDVLGRSPLFDCFVSQNAHRMECLVKCGAKADHTENWGGQVVAKENLTLIKSILQEAGLEFDNDTVGAD